MIHPLVILALMVCSFLVGWFASRLQFALSLRRSIAADPDAAVDRIRRFQRTGL